MLAFALLYWTLGIGQVKDSEVELGDVVKFEQHVTEWNDGDSRLIRLSSNASVIGLETFLASSMGIAAFRRLSDSSRQKHFYERTRASYRRRLKDEFQNRRVPARFRYYEKVQNFSRTKTVGKGFALGSIFFAVDAGTGVVVAMQGNRPLFAHNAPALASYIVRQQLHNAAENNSYSDSVRQEFALMQKALYGAPVRDGQIVTTDAHFSRWQEGESKEVRVAKVIGVDLVGMGLGVGLNAIAKKQMQFIKDIPSRRQQPLSTSELKQLQRSDRTARRIGKVGKGITLIFFAEAVGATVLAIEGNKPVYFGNVAGLVSYAFKHNASTDGADSRELSDRLLQSANDQILETIYAEDQQQPDSAQSTVNMRF